MANFVIGSGGGGKGGGGGGSTAKDNLESTQFGRVLDLLSEGEIGGLVDGKKSIFLNNTPLQNANGTENFKNVDYATRIGESVQEVIPLTQNTSQVKSTGLGTITTNTAGVKTITNSDVDAVKVTIDIPQLQKITDDGDIEGTELKLEIAVQYSGGSYTTLISGDSNVIASENGKIKGRTGDLYQKEYLINLNKTLQAAGNVNIKVTRLTADSTNPKLVNAFQWNTYTEIIYDERTYPNCALVGMKIDAEQFSSIPKRTYLIKGKTVKIPHNATVRSNGSLQYSGTFNGTLGAAEVTNDPAWILFDLLTSSRYGLGTDPVTNAGYLAEADLDKFSFYAASQYCSTQITYTLDGSTITEPRFACNVNIQTAQEATM